MKKKSCLWFCSPGSTDPQSPVYCAENYATSTCHKRVSVTCWPYNMNQIHLLTCYLGQVRYNVTVLCLDHAWHHWLGTTDIRASITDLHSMIMSPSGISSIKTKRNEIFVILQSGLSGRSFRESEAQDYIQLNRLHQKKTRQDVSLSYRWIFLIDRHFSRKKRKKQRSERESVRTCAASDPDSRSTIADESPEPPGGRSIYYRPQTKFVKVMFSQVSVCPRGGGVCPIACWDTPSPLGKTPPRVDTPPGPEADTPLGQTPPPAVHAGIRSTSGRYAS